MLCTFAGLEEGQLEKIRAFEKKTGRVLLAYRCMDMDATQLGEKELKELRTLEDKLCLQLVAVQ